MDEQCCRALLADVERKQGALDAAVSKWGAVKGEVQELSPTPVGGHGRDRGEWRLEGPGALMQSPRHPANVPAAGLWGNIQRLSVGSQAVQARLMWRCHCHCMHKTACNNRHVFACSPPSAAGCAQCVDL